MSVSSRNRDLLILAGICFFCFFFRLGAVSLFDFNEGLYVEAAREIYLSGDFVTPRFNGHVFFDKPPLALWETAVSFHIFGVNEFAARLPVAIAATLLVLLTWWFGARFFSPRAGLLAGAILALSPLYFGTARQMTMDIHQSLWFGAAMICFFLGYTSDCAKGKRWYLGFWIACGLAVMSKSVPGLFPIPAALVFTLVHERFQWRNVFRRIRECRPFVGLLLLAAVIIPWHYLAHRSNGFVFYQEYWLLHHVQLATGNDFNHHAPLYYYVPALLAGLLPWGFILPWALRYRPNNSTSEDVQDLDSHRTAWTFTVVWFATIFIIFSLMNSKLVSYLLPLYPAAALLVGVWLDKNWESRSGNGFALGISGIAVVFAGCAVAAVIYIDRISSIDSADMEYPAVTWLWAAHATSAAAIIGVAAAIFAWRKLNGRATVSLAGSMFALVLFADLEGIPSFESNVNGPLHALAREMGEKMSGGVPAAIHIGQPRKPSVLFYLPAVAFTIDPLKSPSADIIVERGEKEPIDAFLSFYRPAYVLTDARRAQSLMNSTNDLYVEEARGRWVLLRAMPAQSAYRALPRRN